jgi:hypothetical protein
VTFLRAFDQFSRDCEAKMTFRSLHPAFKHLCDPP